MVSEVASRVIGRKCLVCGGGFQTRQRAIQHMHRSRRCWQWAKEHIEPAELAEVTEWARADAATELDIKFTGLTQFGPKGRCPTDNTRPVSRLVT
eukprot:5886428-Amphidinium_carterae.1